MGSKTSALNRQVTGIVTGHETPQPMHLCPVLVPIYKILIGTLTKE